MLYFLKDVHKQQLNNQRFNNIYKLDAESELMKHRKAPSLKYILFG